MFYAYGCLLGGWVCWLGGVVCLDGCLLFGLWFTYWLVACCLVVVFYFCDGLLFGGVERVLWFAGLVRCMVGFVFLFVGVLMFDF